MTKLKSHEILNYRCDECGKPKRHKDMFDEKKCYDCYDKQMIEV